MGRKEAPFRFRTNALRLLATLVLLGLWLMHGVSATTNAGCHGVPMMTSMSTSMSSSMTVAAPANAGAPVVRHAPADEVQMGSGETCLSGQPPSPGHFLLGLLAALALVALAFGLAFRLAHPPSRGANRPPRRGPPGPVGRALLTTVCVSRT